MDGYLVRPGTSYKGGVLVLHAWWGLNDFFRGFCDQIAAEGFIVFAPDLYNGAIASTIPQAEKLRKTLKREQTSKQILVSLKRLKDEVEGKPLALIGFSMGAHWGLWLMEEKPGAFLATVLFYGARGGNYSKSKSAFLGHYAESDRYVSESGRKKLENSLKKAGKEVAFYVYPDTRHWFFESDRAEYNPQAADMARMRTTEFLRKHLE